MKCNLITYSEHAKGVMDDEKSKWLSKNYYTYLFPKYRGDIPCFTISAHKENQYSIEGTYFIGLDWLEVGKTALYIEPKINITNENDESKSYEIDFINMLFSALKHPEVSKEISELFVVKWDEPTIDISQKQDLLTPFLVVEFLALLKTIVRKGLKKSYYKVEHNLQSRVKGKILVGKTIKKNLSQSKNLHTYCSFDEFGVNNIENRLLKKVLTFIKRYLPQYLNSENAKGGINKDFQNTFNYINPAFEFVSDKIELTEIKATKNNALYKEYKEALRLGKMILKRFGYNITNTDTKEKISTPPFWIDMSKLFELYTLGLLKDEFNNDVKFQYSPDRGNELDYLLNSEKYQMVIDAKYKLKYNYTKDNQDIRQVSGYARLNSVYNKLKKDKNEIIEGLIIYPDQSKSGLKNFKDVVFNTKEREIYGYNKIFKVGINLPVIK